MKTQSEFENKIIEHYEKIQDYVQKEISRTFSIYKFLFWGITIILSVGIAVGGIILGTSISSIEGKYENAYTSAVEKEKERIKTEIHNTWETEKSTLNRKIEKEFATENIKLLVETNAQKRIDEIADILIAKQIESKITPLKENLKLIEKNTNNSFDKLIFDYYELGVYNDSKKAFIGLYNLSMDKTSLFHKDASEILNTKVSDLEIFYKREFGEFGSMIDINISDFNLLYNKYKTELNLNSRFYFLEDFWQHSKHDKKKKLELFVKIFNDEISLKSAYYIGKILVDEYKLSVKPYDFIGIQEKINKH